MTTLKLTVNQTPLVGKFVTAQGPQGPEGPPGSGGLTEVDNDDWIVGGTPLSVANGGTGSTTAGDARTALGLGSIATQAAGSVAITGGAIDGAVIGGTTAAAITGTTVTATNIVASQIGRVGDTDLLSLGTNVLTVNGALTATTRIKCAEYGVDGDNNVLQLSINTATVNGTLVAGVGVIVPQIGAAADPDVLQFATNTATVNGTAVATTAVRTPKLQASTGEDVATTNANGVQVPYEKRLEIKGRPAENRTYKFYGDIFGDLAIDPDGVRTTFLGQGIIVQGYIRSSTSVGTASNPVPAVYLTNLYGTGDAGIGATSPSARLHVQTSTTDGRAAVKIEHRDEDQAFIEFENNGSAIGTDGTKNWTSGSAGTMSPVDEYLMVLNPAGQTRWIRLNELT